MSIEIHLNAMVAGLVTFSISKGHLIFYSDIEWVPSAVNSKAFLERENNIDNDS